MNLDLVIAYGSAAEQLARRTAQLSGAEVVEVNRRLFPDGEQYVKVSGEVKGKDVAVFQSFAFHPDTLLVEYALIVDALKGMGCSRVIGVLPYLAYARQDERFNRGEPLSARVFASLIEATGTDEVFTVDMHLHRFHEIREVFSIPASNLTAMPLLAGHYLEKGGSPNALVVGPDSESRQWASKVSESLSSECVILEKERLGDRQVKVSELRGSNLGSAVIVDDMVSTGRTLLEVIGKLRRIGIERIDAIATHSLLVEDAFIRLRDAGLASLITTDTIENPHTKVSVAPLLARTLLEKYGGRG
ncbi:MAG: ribose-phosphate diphosphokinase [Candidatus Verstraetearchaeota archaeon]|nr:ribose-phosphate diphosphokinase [Candidatus Verstraetearchaeota archaeon]